MTRLRRRLAIAAGIAVLALVPRLAGLGKGLPDESHHYSFHPDEYNVVRVLAAMEPSHLDFNPRYFHNPTLYYYLCGAAYLGARAVGFLPPLDRGAFHERPGDVARFYLLGRGLAAAAGALTAAVVFLAAAGVAGNGAGLLAAAVVALSPAHLILSHDMDVDTLLGLMISLALLGLLHMLRTPARGPALAAGIAAGLAAGTKYNGVLALVPVFTAVILGPGRRFQRLALAASATTVAFLASTPYAVLDGRGFRDGIRYVLEERVRGRWSHLGHGMLFPLAHSWPWLVGEGGLVLAAVGITFGLKNRTRETVTVTALALATYASLAASGTDYVRYSVPALPALGIAGGFALAAARGPLTRAGVAILTAVAMLTAIVRASALMALLLGPDVRDLASRHLDDTWPQGTLLLVPREPYFFSPPRVFMDYFYQGRSASFRRTGRYPVLSADWSSEALADAAPSVVIVSEHELLYPAAAGSGTGRFLDALINQGSFVEVARFDRPARIGPLLLEAPLPPPGSGYLPEEAAWLRDHRLPHDLKYLNPAVLFYVPLEERP